MLKHSKESLFEVLSPSATLISYFHEKNFSATKIEFRRSWIAWCYFLKKRILARAPRWLRILPDFKTRAVSPSILGFSGKCHPPWKKLCVKGIKIQIELLLVEYCFGKLWYRILRWCASPSMCTHKALYAHIKHTPGTLILIKIMHAPDVCHMCADTWVPMNDKKSKSADNFLSNAGSPVKNVNI